MYRRAFLVALSAIWLLDDMAHLICVAAAIPKLAFFGFQLINTSVVPTSFGRVGKKLHLLRNVGGITRGSAGGL